MTKAFATSLAATAILCLLAAAPAHAGGAAKTHDGFMLRLSLGMGTASSKIDDPLGSIDLSGTTTDLNFAIGGMVRPNLAIHGTIFGWSVGSPDIEVSGPAFGSGSGNLDATLTLNGFAPGVTYYFMPANVYLSGSVGFGTLDIEGDLGEGSTDTGLALDLTLGKEWWVSNSWGLGAAAGFTYHSLPDKDVDSSWSGTSFTARFTATLN